MCKCANGNEKMEMLKAYNKLIILYFIVNCQP
jgi:hypothetical protein